MSLKDDINKIIRTPKDVQKEKDEKEKQDRIVIAKRNAAKLLASLLELISVRAKNGEYKTKRNQKIFRGTMVCYDSITIYDDSRDGFHTICDIFDMQPESKQYGRELSFSYKYTIPTKAYEAFEIFEKETSQEGIKISSPYLVDLKYKKNKKIPYHIATEFTQSSSHTRCIRGSFGERIQIAFDYSLIIE